MDMMRVLELKIEHMHDDHSWHKLQPAEHGSGPADSERQWDKRRLFRCVGCDEEVRIGKVDDGLPTD